MGVDNLFHGLRHSFAALTGGSGGTASTSKIVMMFPRIRFGGSGLDFFAGLNAGEAFPKKEAAIDGGLFARASLPAALHPAPGGWHPAPLDSFPKGPRP
jgi:hypothetical protein